MVLNRKPVPKKSLENRISYLNNNPYNLVTLRCEKADLQIIRLRDGFYKEIDPEMYDEYTDDAMNHMECPVIIVPGHFSQPERIVLTYDGSRSSVMAIKQFAYYCRS